MKRLNKKRFRSLFLLLIFFGPAVLIGQIRIKAETKTLDTILQDLNETYGLAFSIDAKQAKECYLTLDTVFDHPKKALSALLKECDLTYKETAGVFSIYRGKEEKTSVQNNTPIFFNFWMEKMKNPCPMPAYG